MALHEREDSTANNDKEREKQERRDRRKRKRWGPAAAETAPAATTAASASTIAAAPPMSAAAARVQALQASVAARLAAAKAGTTAKVVPVTQAVSSMSEHQHQHKRAKVYDLDLSVTAPINNQSTIVGGGTASSSYSAGSSRPIASSKTKQPPKPPSNPYLAHTVVSNEADHDDASRADTADATAANDNHSSNNVAVDVGHDEALPRSAKPRPRHRTFRESSTEWHAVGDAKRARARAAAQAGFASGRKTGHTLQSVGQQSSRTNTTSATGGGTANTPLVPRADTNPDTTMPLVVEWWDAELLPSVLKKQVAALESQALVQARQAQTMAPFAQRAVTNDSGTAATTEEQQQQSELVETLRDTCYAQASLSHSKTAALVQHIVPIRPLHETTSHGNKNNNNSSKHPPQQVLHLTKKELKRQRKLRRQEKQRRVQDLQAAGLLPAPEPRLTLSNYMAVLGDAAWTDPSQMERKVAAQMATRQRQHEERNAAAKLSKEARSAKRAKKYEEDTSASVTVAIFHVRSMRHPYHRAKVDLNAQQLNLSGCVLECGVVPDDEEDDGGAESSAYKQSVDAADSFACVLVEGGPKAIQRFVRLMTVRMKWTGPDDGYDDDDDEEEDVAMMNPDETADPDDPDAPVPIVRHKFDKDNACQLVWKGLAVQRLFHGFVFSTCVTSAQGRSLWRLKGAEHYWNQALEVQKKVTGTSTGQTFKLRLGDSDDDDEDANAFASKDEDVILDDA